MLSTTGDGKTLLRLRTVQVTLLLLGKEKHVPVDLVQCLAMPAFPLREPNSFRHAVH